MGANAGGGAASWGRAFTMHTWISRYRAEGASALCENGNAQRRTYSEEIRQKAVEEYLSGLGSSMAIAEKYKLRSGNLVLDRAKEYHRHRESPKETGGVSVARRKHTLTEAFRGRGVPCAADRYYRWHSGRAGARTVENRRLAGLVKQIQAENPDKGYRCILDDLARYYGAPVNDKRALRICRSLGVHSTIQYTRRVSDPQYLAENVLNRQFYADKPNEKWLTDVTEFKYYVGSSVHKLYLSAIDGSSPLSSTNWLRPR